jgi:hypothetical protein
MGKNQDPGSGIRDKHPGTATLIHKAIFRKKIDFKFDYYLRLFTDIAHNGTQWRLHDSFKITVAVRSYSVLFKLQRHYEAIRVWSYTTFIVIEARGQQETSGRNLKDLESLIKNNHP